MIHLTCLAHGLHRIAEEVRSLFPDVDILISNIKKIFLKAPSRIQLFKSIAPNLNLPPQPILTRWGTWISAAIYYATNFEKIIEIIDQLNEEDAASIKITKYIALKSGIHSDLAFILSHFAHFPSTKHHWREKVKL